MHIAMNGWFWEQPETGSGQYVRELLRALARLNADMRLTLVLPPHITAPGAVPDNVDVLRTSGGVGGKLGKVWFEQNLYPGAVKRVGADIAHVPYWGPPLSVNAKLVTSVLDVIPLLYPEYIGGFATRLYTSLVRAAAVGSAHIITLSEAGKGDVVVQLDVPADSVTAIHLAPKEVYHHKLGSENDAAVREKYHLPDDPFILYLGGFDVRKQIDQLLAAYTYVVRAHGELTPLVLAGREPPGREPLFPDMRAYAAELDIPDDNLYWLGYVDEDDKPALYRMAEIFAYPSAYEGFGLPLLEAMVSGTPVVANAIPVFDEIAADGAFLVEPGKAAKMGGALVALLEQPDLYDGLRSSGIARATNFTWRKTARATLEVYQRVMA